MIDGFNFNRNFEFFSSTITGNLRKIEKNKAIQNNNEYKTICKEK